MLRKTLDCCEEQKDTEFFLHGNLSCSIFYSLDQQSVFKDDEQSFLFFLRKKVGYVVCFNEEDRWYGGFFLALLLSVESPNQ